MGLIGDIKLLLKARSVLNRFKDEVRDMGLGSALKTVGVLVGPPVVAYVTGFCPALFSLNGGIAVGAGVVGAVLSRGSSLGAGKSMVAGVGLAGALGLAYYQAIAEIGKLCGTGFIEQLPTILAAALAIGIGAYINGRKV